MFRAIVDFVDLRDNRHLYRAGDEFPRKGLKVDDERLVSLQSNANTAHMPLIREIPTEDKKPAQNGSESVKRRRAGKRK